MRSLFSLARLCSLLLLIALVAPTAQAQDTTENAARNKPVILTSRMGSRTAFYPSTPENLARSFIKLSGVDLKDDLLLDDYAIVGLCNLYQSYYNDEFAWRKARDAMRDYIQNNIEKFPEYIVFFARIQIDRYDFGIKAFHLDKKSVFSRTGKFTIYARPFGQCTNIRTSRIPQIYSLRLSNPITLDAIPLKEERAYQVLRTMKENGNLSRIAYVGFFIRMDDFVPQLTPNGVERSDAHATLIAMRFYEDPEHTKMIYEYIPESTNPFAQ